MSVASSSSSATGSLNPTERGGPALTIVLALLGFSVFINYIDRSNLAVAASLLKDELGLSGSQLGILLSAFFWSYGLFQILSGWLVDRFNVNWVMAGGFLLWSAATGATGLAHGFVALLVLRLILGVGESVAFPSYSKIMAKYFPGAKRTSANGVINAGLASGPAFGMLLGGVLMSRFGWRLFFIVLGFGSLLWLVPWLRWMPRGPGLDVEKHHEGAAPTIWDILQRRPAWGTFLGLFCNNYVLYFLIAWLPFYLVRERHFSMDSMAKIGGAVYLTQAATAAVCGRIADRWLARGATRTRVHLTFVVAGALVAGIGLMAATLVSPLACVGVLILIGVASGMAGSNIWIITQTLAGPKASGQWTGLQCSCSNLSGVIGAALTGWLLDRTGHFYWAFSVAAGISFAGILSWLILVSPVQPVVWAADRRVLTSPS